MHHKQEMAWSHRLQVLQHEQGSARGQLVEASKRIADLLSHQESLDKQLNASEAAVASLKSGALQEAEKHSKLQETLQACELKASMLYVDTLCLPLNGV